MGSQCLPDASAPQNAIIPEGDCISSSDIDDLAKGTKGVDLRPPRDRTQIEAQELRKDYSKMTSKGLEDLSAELLCFH